MILVDEKKLKQSVLNIMADFEINGFSSLGVCIGEVDDFQVHIKITKEEDELYDRVSSADKCITESASP